MPVPPNAFKFPNPMDPTDLIDFELKLDGKDGVLESGELVASYTLTLLSEAVALGLTISQVAGYTPTLFGGRIKFWLYVDAGFRDNPAYAGAGVPLGMELTITTNSSPARRRQRTIVIEVAQQ